MIHHHPKRPQKRKVSPVGPWVVLAQCFILMWFYVAWSTVTMKITSSLEKNEPNLQQSHDTTNNPQLEIAMDIPGMELHIPSPIANEAAIQVVFPSSATSPQANGIVLLLHACTHTGLKFFSSSHSCPNCTGLSEELRIVRLVVQKGYIPLALTSLNSATGCWSEKDTHRVQAVLQHALFATQKRVYAIGASSGGAFAAQLLTQDIVQAALVMVMSLRTDIVKKLLRHPKPIFLATMPRDRGTTIKAIQNYNDLQVLNTDRQQLVILDTQTCDSLPLTTAYLLQRVPGMTTLAAEKLILQFKQAQHLDYLTNMLLVDPTQSNWRNILSPSNTTFFMDKFILKPGYSPLAKALHRAWAFHEYCSEVVIPALNLFEENTLNKERERE